MRLGIFGAAPYSYRALPLLYSGLSARTFELRLERRTPDLLRNVSEHYSERTSVESACVLAVCTGLDALRGVTCNAVLAFFCVPHLEHTPGKSGIIAVGFDERFFDCARYVRSSSHGDGPYSFQSAGEVEIKQIVRRSE